MREYTLKGKWEGEEREQEGWRPFGIGDIKIDLLRRMAAENISRFATVLTSFSTSGDMDWEEAGGYFHVRRSLLSLFPSPPFRSTLESLQIY